MHVIFMNFENSKVSYSNRLLIDLSDKVDLKRGNNQVTLSSFRIYYTWKKYENVIQQQKIENISSNVEG